jgi:cellulose synthase/poly-beta-1,6-N-acetylglucosamine synthase-like glycosyltransferase
MTTVSLVLVLLPLALLVAAYVVYPLLLALLAALRPAAARVLEPARFPTITLTVPVYNEASSIGSTLESLLRLDYPADKRQIVVISDASTDGTDDIVREFADRGVELVRLPERRGKTAAENAAGSVARGDLVINIDATVRLRPRSLHALVRAFLDPTVGVASGRDVSVGADEGQTARGESGYVGFEMWIRSLETRLGSIVGASGCFYGIRRALYDARFPEQLSRDFASALIAREHGLRAVSVDDAICEVPRTSSLQSELRRKTRTMARGLETLWYKRHLMNPVRHGAFALMLVGHKLARWLVYPALPGAMLGLIVLSFESRTAAALLAVGVAVLTLGIVGMRWRGERVPLVFAVPGFIVAANVAGLLAWKKVLRRERSPTWEPTRRPA